MSPTNMLRRASRRQPAAARPVPRRGQKREVLIRAGAAIVRARLLDTPTADRVWASLPIYSVAETWGRSIHFETRVETGREPGAKASVAAGEIAFWVEEDRIIVGFGRTPISRPGEIRLPAPCNIWAIALDDVEALAQVHPGGMIAVLVAES